ncbi:hypothetical protein BC628DRAFT_820341 [Trametes gibbosa]|nr:hypothetical protein BC628DRAFT_820341 [Trametes gibbosa]
MYTHNIFANATTKCSSTTAAMLLSRFTTTPAYLPKLNLDAPEWDPSRDEIVNSKTSGRWGAIGGERRARHQQLQLESIWTQTSYSRALQPAWPPLSYLTSNRPGATPFEREWLPEETYRQREAVETKPWKPAQTAMRSVVRRCEREEMEALTESFNPFNPANVAAREVAEAKLASAHRAALEVHPETDVALGPDTMARGGVHPPSTIDCESRRTPSQSVQASPTVDGDSHGSDSSTGSTPSSSNGSSPSTTGASPLLGFCGSSNCTTCEPDDLWLDASLKRSRAGREPAENAPIVVVVDADLSYADEA